MLPEVFRITSDILVTPAVSLLASVYRPMSASVRMNRNLHTFPLELTLIWPTSMMLSSRLRLTSQIKLALLTWIWTMGTTVSILSLHPRKPLLLSRTCQMLIRPRLFSTPMQRSLMMTIAIRIKWGLKLNKVSLPTPSRCLALTETTSPPASVTSGSEQPRSCTVCGKISRSWESIGNTSITGWVPAVCR